MREQPTSRFDQRYTLAISMKVSQLPVHLILFVLALLDEDSSVHADRSPSTLYTVSPLSVLESLSYDGITSGKYSNWTRRAIDGEGEEQDVICHPAGSCEPCPDDLMQEPFCQPFGNRRLLHCLSASPAPDTNESSTESPPDDHKSDGGNGDNESHSPPPHHPASRPPQSALPAWESCGRRVPKERADFFEFVLCNVIFAALALTGVLIRSERMRAVRARRLAARIGVGLRRASSGSWTAMGSMGSAFNSGESRITDEEGLMRAGASHS